MKSNLLQAKNYERKKFLLFILTVLIVACSSQDGVDSNNNYIQNTDTNAPIITIVGDTLINVSRGNINLY